MAAKKSAKNSAAMLTSAAMNAKGEAAVLEALKKMPASDRMLGERIHAIVKKSAPTLVPRTWYGMPAYSTPAGKIVCFFQNASKFKTRYATVGFQHEAKLDNGNMWPTSYAVLKLTPADEKKIAALVKKAVR